MRIRPVDLAVAAIPLGVGLIAGYVVLAGLAALLASVVPVRRAATVPVIEGLALE